METGEVLVSKDTVITPEMARKVQDARNKYRKC